MLLQSVSAALRNSQHFHEVHTEQLSGTPTQPVGGVTLYMPSMHEYRSNGMFCCTLCKISASWCPCNIVCFRLSYIISDTCLGVARSTVEALKDKGHPPSHGGTHTPLSPKEVNPRTTKFHSPMKASTATPPPSAPLGVYSGICYI